MPRQIPCEQFAELSHVIGRLSLKLGILSEYLDFVDTTLRLQGAQSHYIAMALQIEDWRDDLDRFNLQVVQKQAMIRLSLLRIIKLG